VALPTLTTFEKSGTFVNKDGIHQKFLPTMEPANFGRNEPEMFHDLARDFKAEADAAAASNGAAKVKA
jgi:predicted molibdopterin-dependent oxidoreductase YjgC